MKDNDEKINVEWEERKDKEENEKKMERIKIKKEKWRWIYREEMKGIGWRRNKRWDEIIEKRMEEKRRKVRKKKRM